MSVLSNELNAVVGEYSSGFNELCFLKEILSLKADLIQYSTNPYYIILVKQIVGDCKLELLQDWIKYPVVQRQIDVGMSINKPAGQGSLGSGQLPLDRMLTQNCHRLLTKCSIPGERLCLKRKNESNKN